MSVKPRNTLLLIIIFFSTLSVFTALSCVYLYFSRPKIAYVRSLELVYSFNGMRQAHAEYKTQTDAWQANIDTLKKQYQNAVSVYKSHVSLISPQQKNDEEKNIMQLENSLKQYSATVSKEAEEREKKLTQSVLNQINSYVESYAKKKGYDIVLGAEGTGSVIYGKPAFDITNDVLESMNKEYQLLPSDTTARTQKN
ncbi:MAG: OmpH family outer membrane protein [Flavipsychrobacter sp.]|nr:OmpH family outer membrane protein [Flavipsychrobacter sp.]